MVARADLELEGETSQPRDRGAPSDEIGVIEAVVGAELAADRPRRPGSSRLHERLSVNLLAVSRSGERFTRAAARHPLRAGDVIVLQGNLGALPDKLRELGCLPLADARAPARQRAPRASCRSRVLAAAMVLVALSIVPVADRLLRRGGR